MKLLLALSQLRHNYIVSVPPKNLIKLIPWRVI